MTAVTYLTRHRRPGIVILCSIVAVLSMLFVLPPAIASAADSGAQAVDECNPTASNGCVNGILQDADKKPIADVTITLSGKATAETKTAADGSTTFLLWTYSNNIANSWWLRIVAWVLVVIAALLCWRWFHSPWGRMLKGIREDENAIRSLGKPVTRYKMESLILGGLFGAIAGIIFVLPRSVQPDSLGRTVTFYVWTILLLGGAATILGPVLGSCVLWVLLTFVKEVMRNTVPETLISSNQIEALGWVIVGVALMCLVIFRPQGLLGDRKELAFHA